MPRLHLNASILKVSKSKSVVRVNSSEPGWCTQNDAHFTSSTITVGRQKMFSASAVRGVSCTQAKEEEIKNRKRERERMSRPFIIANRNGLESKKPHWEVSYENKFRPSGHKDVEKTHASEADWEAGETSRIQRRTEAAGGCTETSGSGSRTGRTGLEQRHNTHQSPHVRYPSLVYLIVYSI